MNQQKEKKQIVIQFFTYLEQQEINHNQHREKNQKIQNVSSGNLTFFGIMIDGNIRLDRTRNDLPQEMKHKEIISMDS